MAIEIDYTAYSPSDDDQLTALHIRVIPMMASTIVEIVTYDGRGLDRPQLKIRGMLPYNILSMPSLHQTIWCLGDELQRTAAEMNKTSPE